MADAIEYNNVTRVVVFINNDPHDVPQEIAKWEDYNGMHVKSIRIAFPDGLRPFVEVRHSHSVTVIPDARIIEFEYDLKV